MIELFLKGVHLPPGMPWCAAFVHHVGKWSHYDPVGAKSSWPLPATGSCERLHTFATERDILRAEPSDGDVFLIWERGTFGEPRQPSGFGQQGVVDVQRCAHDH